MISAKDLQRICALASEQAELAASPEMEKLYADWMAHGRFDSDSRPMIRIELWTFEGDIIPQLMECEGQEAREIEQMLLNNIVNHTLFGDDTLVKSYIPVNPVARFVPFGLEVKREVEAGGGVGHHFIPYLEDLDEDFHLLGKSVYSLDLEAQQKRVDYLSELIGDIIPVRKSGMTASACPMQDIVHIMSMEDMYVAMYDEPEKFHEMLAMLVRDYNEFYTYLEEQGVLLPTARDEHLSQGTYSFTDELPAQGVRLKKKDIWLYMDSQETSGVSPAMYKEIVLPHYKELAKEFGLFSYGCCEAVHDLWDGGLEHISNLRKLSISPWCDEEMIGDRLRGKKVVYLRKPTPNLLGVGSVLDEDACREHFMATVKAARGCSLEIAQRDVYQINNTSEKVRRYVQIARECMDKHQR